MTVLASFAPRRGSNQVVTPAAASATVSIDPVAKSVRLVNSGAALCYVRIGTSASGQPATVADTPILSLSSVILSKGEGEGTLSYISATGTTLNIQTGEGGVE